MKCHGMNKEIQLLWIPIHSGIINNENVDRLTYLVSLHGQLLEIDLPLKNIQIITKIMQKLEW